MSYICRTNRTQMLAEWQIKVLYETLGQRIKKRREEKKWKQAYFASLLKISRASLVNIEQGRQHPPLHNLYEISRVLEISIFDLLPELATQPNPEIRPQYEEEMERKKVSTNHKFVHFVESA